MEKKSTKKEDDSKKVVAKCDHPNEVIANCDNPQESAYTLLSKSVWKGAAVTTSCG